MKTYLLKQPAGLGDILFIQKIAETIKSRGHRVIWPVASVYNDIGNYITYQTFVDKESNFEFKEEYESTPDGMIIKYDNCYVVGLDGCGKYFPSNGVLKAKYDMVGMDWKNWQNFVNITRNKTKEKELFYDVLGLKDKDKFSLINDFMGSPPDIIKLNINAPLKYKRVDLNIIKGFSLFDWIYTAEKASEIFLEGSALTYILEKINLSNAETLGLYSRNYHAIEGIFNNAWKYLGPVKY